MIYRQSWSAKVGTCLPNSPSMHIFCLCKFNRRNVMINFCISVGETMSQNWGLQHASRPTGSVSEPNPRLFSKIHTSYTQILRTIALTSNFVGGNYVQELWSAVCQSAFRKCLWIKSYSVLSEIPTSYIHIRKTYYMWRGERELIPQWPKSYRPIGPAGSGESHQ